MARGPFEITCRSIGLCRGASQRRLCRAFSTPKGARAWRREHGCCSEHRTGDAFDCPCDQWVIVATSLATDAPGGLSANLYQLCSRMRQSTGSRKSLHVSICSKAGLGLGDGKREGAAKVFRSFLSRNGARFAGDAIAVMGFAYNRPARTDNHRGGGGGIVFACGFV